MRIQAEDPLDQYANARQEEENEREGDPRFEDGMTSVLEKRSHKLINTRQPIIICNTKYLTQYFSKPNLMLSFLLG
jgi:hypothetical protein